MEGHGITHGMTLRPSSQTCRARLATRPVGWQMRTRAPRRHAVGMAARSGTSYPPLRRLNVAEVGEWYLTTRSRADDPQVIAAYAQLQLETDRLFAAVARAHGPHAVRIVFTRCRQPYGCDRDLIAAVRSQRILEITTAAATAGRIHPQLGCGFGGGFDRFRAIHDLLGHAIPGFGFDLGSEIAAWRVQSRMHGRQARLALATELLGVNSARRVIGDTPELKAMVFEPSLLVPDQSVAGAPKPVNLEARSTRPPTR